MIPRYWIVKIKDISTINVSYVLTISRYWIAKIKLC